MQVRPPPEDAHQRLTAFPAPYAPRAVQHPLSPLAPQEEAERKYSGTMGSSYDYRPQMVYPNAEPFRKDLDRKLTTIEHEEPNEYYSRVVVRSSLPQDTPAAQLAPADPLCFNLCCLLLLVLGLASISLCLYLAVEQGQAAGGEESGHGLLRGLILE